MLNQNFYQTASSDFRNFDNSEKWKNNQCLYFKQFQRNFCIFNEIYLKEHCLEYACSKFQFAIFKTVEFYYFEGENGHFSRHSRGFLYFPDFHILSEIGYWKGVFVSFFALLTKNGPKNIHNNTRTQNFQFGLLLNT